MASMGSVEEVVPGEHDAFVALPPHDGVVLVLLVIHRGGEDAHEAQQRDEHERVRPPSTLAQAGHREEPISLSRDGTLVRVRSESARVA